MCERKPFVGRYWKILKDAILSFPKNPVIAHLNFNSLKNKINDLRILIQGIPLDYFVLSETKLDKSFPTAQFHNPGYKVRARKDPNKYGGGLIEYIKKGVICSKRIQKFEKLTWICFFRIENCQEKMALFRHISTSNTWKLWIFLWRTNW